MKTLITPVILVCNDEYWLPWALEASRGFFDRYVIYDIGSKDRTREIITWFKDSNKEASFYIRFLDMQPPAIQGIFRNSMIAEALSECYFILDGDEIYSPSSYVAIQNSVDYLLTQREKLYGIIPRVEIDSDCKGAYGVGAKTPHHRLYHRCAIWTGSHPGEVPYTKQKPNNEIWIDGTCYHFHNCERSSYDSEVPKRIERRARATYRPGQKQSIEILKELPILEKNICDFKRNPALQKLIDDK